MRKVKPTSDKNLLIAIYALIGLPAYLLLDSFIFAVFVPVTTLLISGLLALTLGMGVLLRLLVGKLLGTNKRHVSQ